MYVTIENKLLTFHGRPTTQAIEDMGPVLLQIGCKQSKENIRAVADLMNRTTTYDPGFSSDLYHPASCGVHPRFDGVALLYKAGQLAVFGRC